MDIHIERPTLNAASSEENIAIIDTWIADTSDKLNVAMKSSGVSATTSDSSQTANGFDKRYASASATVYLGSGRRKVTSIVLED